MWKDIGAQNTLRSNSGELEVTIGVKYDENGEYKYYMPSVIFKVNPRGFESYDDIFWDGEDFIFNEFLSFLNRWKRRQLLSTDEEEFKEVWKWVNNENNNEDLINMLELALKLKWYTYES